MQHNGYNSSSLDITCGVPQGSILGPLLFLVYINDLCNVPRVLGLILFADDTHIFYSHTDASYLMEVVNLELKNITCWFYADKLSINVKKSNFIIFRPRQNRQTLDLAFNIRNYSIDHVKEATFLGIILDEHLTGNEIVFFFLFFFFLLLGTPAPRARRLPYSYFKKGCRRE